MSAVELWATTSLAGASITVRSMTQLHSSELHKTSLFKDDVGASTYTVILKSHKVSVRASLSLLYTCSLNLYKSLVRLCFAVQMEGAVRDERGQEEPWAGGGQQQDLCRWRTRGTG